MKISYISSKEFSNTNNLQPKYKKVEIKKHSTLSEDIDNQEKRKNIIGVEVRLIEDKERTVYVSDDGFLFTECRWLDRFYVLVKDGSLWKLDKNNENMFVKCA